MSQQSGRVQVARQYESSIQLNQLFDFYGVLAQQAVQDGEMDEQCDVDKMTADFGYFDMHLCNLRVVICPYCM
jgi:hypothetical protein